MRLQQHDAMECSLTAASSQEPASDRLASLGDTKVVETKGIIQPLNVSQSVPGMPRLELPLSCSARASTALQITPRGTSQHLIAPRPDEQAKEFAHDGETDRSLDATSDSEYAASGRASDAAASAASGVDAVLRRLQHGQARLAEVQGSLQEMQIRVLTYVEDKLQEHRASWRRELAEEVVKQVTTMLASRCDDPNLPLLEHDAAGTEQSCASSSHATMEPLQNRAWEQRAAEQESVTADHARKINGIRADLAWHAKRFAAMEEGLRSSIGNSVEELRRFQDTVSALIATGESEAAGQLMRKVPPSLVASRSPPLQFRNDGSVQPRSTSSDVDVLQAKGLQTEALHPSRMPSAPRLQSERCACADRETGSRPLSSRFPRSSVHPLVSPTSTTCSRIIVPEPPSPKVTVQHRPAVERLPCEPVASGAVVGKRSCQLSVPDQAQNTNAPARSSSVPLSPTLQTRSGEPKSFVTPWRHGEDGSRSTACLATTQACQVRSSQTNLHERVRDEGMQLPPREVGSGCVVRTPSLSRQEPSTDVTNWMFRQVQVIPPSRYKR